MNIKLEINEEESNVYRHWKEREFGLQKFTQFLKSGKLLLLVGLLCSLMHFESNAQGTVQVEAETGTLSGSAQVYSDGPASGGQGVAFLHLVGNAFTLSGVPASTSMEIFYASQQTGAISLFINGQDAGNIAFTSNGTWVGNYTSVTHSVNIPANSSVQIINQSGDMAMNVDYILFSGGGGTDPTCDDGVQNGDETGIDCGGSCAACATCSDGIQNQGEEGIDCGGPCTACATCADGILNQGEEDVDCGGPCAACATCFDGIQNQGEEAVDCGGPCTACATCSDGIQNQGETGIDCGGPCTECVTTGSTQIEAESATILGSASIYNDGPASQGQGVAFISSQGAGFTMTNVPAASTIEVAYASELSGNLSYFINGQDAGDFSFTSSGAWVGNYVTISTNVNIPAGSTFEVIFQNGDAAMNIDYVTFIGGPIDPPVETCEDGVQNQGEEGIDCGGPCAACPPVETCTDGIQNQGETGVDCGGPCTACASCSDGIQNQGEQGVDCGGPCVACDPVATCSDGIQNQGEEGIDCGGPCTACISEATCTDGIQNGDETGVDCGGSCVACTQTEVVVTNANNATAGEILVGGPGSSQPGFSIYTFDNDNGGPFSQCEGDCANTWPPVLVNNVESAVIDNLPAAFDQTFGVSGRCDGTLQLTYGGEPLYFFNQDNNLGDINGDNQGGVWHLVRATVVDPEPTCDDNIQNQGEEGVDCGGPCAACPPVPTCSDNIQNQGETGVDCGGPCAACEPTGPSEGQCEGFGLSYTGGNTGILYSHESLGAPCFMCTGPGFNGCVPSFTFSDGFYQLEVNVSEGQAYSFGIQCGPNVLVEGVVGAGNNCYVSPSCTDGIQNGDETDIDCGGSSCIACPTCDDGIQNGDELGIDCGGSNCTGNKSDCATVCNGTPNPFADVSSTNESFENENDGTITFSYVNISGRETIEFSLDGGLSYPHTTADNTGSFTVANLSPGSYAVFVRWGNGGDCPTSLGTAQIQEGGPVPTCSDGIRNQGEERVDCGGPCTACLPDNCGDLPTVLYPTPSLATPIPGSPARRDGWAFDLSEDLSTVAVRVGENVGIQMGGNQNSFEFFCSCNQITFDDVALGASNSATVPQSCQDAGDFFYFFRYKKNGNTTSDPGDIYHYSGLFTTAGDRIDPDNRASITVKAANWMRYRHPHPQDGITEAIFDAQHNGSRLRQIDRFETVVFDDGSNIRFEQFLYDSQAGHANQVRTDELIQNGGTRIPVRRIEFLEDGANTPPSYAAVFAPGGPDFNQGGDLFPYSDVPTVNYGNIISYELTAVTVDWPGGAQNYNTFQNYVAGQGFNTFGDPRLAMAGRASTNMVISGSGSHVPLEADAIFTQHLITLEDENDVDSFLEGHHLFHGVRHRADGDNQNDNAVLGEVKIGSTFCAECHFRDGRSSEVFNTPNGEFVAPAVYGVGLLEWIAGAEVGLTWDGSVATVADQTRNALINDHGINPDTDISGEHLQQIIDYTQYLTVPTRSKGAYDDPDVVRGDVVFHEVGCTACHQPTQITRNDAPVEFRSITIRPYTDMKLHTVTDQAYRTPALWGLGRNIDLLDRNGRALILMHDGRATSIEGAIEAHGGEASGSRAAYRNLSGSDQQALVKFIETL